MKFWDNYVKLIILQGVIAVIVVLSVVVLKYGFKGSYVKFENWYKENILTDTSIYEVIK